MIKENDVHICRNIIKGREQYSKICLVKDNYIYFLGNECYNENISTI